MTENKKSKFPSEADVVIVGVGGIVHTCYVLDGNRHSLWRQFETIGYGS